MSTFLSKQHLRKSLRDFSVNFKSIFFFKIKYELDFSKQSLVSMNWRRKRLMVAVAARTTASFAEPSPDCWTPHKQVCVSRQLTAMLPLIFPF